MESTQSLLAQIASTRKAAQRNLSEVPLATRAGIEMRKRQAIEELPGLFAKLQKTVVPARLVGLVATGDPEKVGAIAELLVGNGGVVLDAAALYTDLAKKVEPSYNRERRFLQNQFAGIVARAQEIANEVAFDGLTFEFNEDSCPTFEQSVAHIRKIVRGGAGDRLNLAYLARQAATQIVERELAAEKLPALVTRTIPGELPVLRSLFARSVVFEVPADFEVTKDSVLNVLRTAT